MGRRARTINSGRVLELTYQPDALVSLGFIMVLLASPLPAQSPATPLADAQQTAAPGLQTGSPAVTPAAVPNVLDGLESLQLVKDPEFGPPIVGGDELFQGHLSAGPPGVAGQSGYMKPLEADLSTPDLAAPSLQAPLDSGALPTPNLNTPLLEIPNTFATPSLPTGLDSLGIPGLSLQKRPLGTIGAPTFLRADHSVAIGSTRVRFGAAVNAAIAYNNNVFGASTNPKADTIFSLQPTIYLETGKKGTMQFLWSPSFLQYARYKQLSSLNQAFVFTSRYRWTKLRVGLDASYLAQSGLFLNSQGQAQQKEIYAHLFAGYSLTKKTEVVFDFSGTGTESDPGGRQFQGTFNASIDYKYSRKTTIGAGVALGYFYSSSGVTTSESFLLRLLYNPTSKLVFRGEGGLQFRQSSSSSGGSSAATSIVNMSLIYTPSPKTYVSLRFFRSVDMDAFNAGNLQITTSLESSASWRIFRSTTLSGSLAAGQIENVAMDGQQQDKYNFVQASVAVSYLLNDGMNVNLFNNLQQKLNDTQGNNYLSNTSGMSLGLRF